MKAMASLRERRQATDQKDGEPEKSCQVLRARWQRLAGEIFSWRTSTALVPLCQNIRGQAVAENELDTVAEPADGVAVAHSLGSILGRFALQLHGMKRRQMRASLSGDCGCVQSAPPMRPRPPLSASARASAGDWSWSPRARYGCRQLHMSGREGGKDGWGMREEAHRCRGGGTAEPVVWPPIRVRRGCRAWPRQAPSCSCSSPASSRRQHSIPHTGQPQRHPAGWLVGPRTQLRQLPAVAPLPLGSTTATLGARPSQADLPGVESDTSDLAKPRSFSIGSAAPPPRSAEVLCCSVVLRCCRSNPLLLLLLLSLSPSPLLVLAMSDTKLYDLLGVSPSATEAEMKKVSDRGSSSSDDRPMC